MPAIDKDRTEKLMNLVRLKFGNNRGSRAKAAKSLSMSAPNFYNMCNGLLSVPEKYMDALDALPDYKQDSFTFQKRVLTMAGKVRLNHVDLKPVTLDKLDRIAATFTGRLGGRITQDQTGEYLDNLVEAQFERLRKQIEAFENIQNENKELDDPNPLT